MGKLTLDDISDVRAYERERDEFRSQIIELRKARRVALGPILTIVFENRDTVRFQIQEMARAEGMLTDEAIQTELDIYNALIPEPNHLTATLFVELTTKAELREWLPKLVGIERCLGLRIGEGGEASVVRAVPQADHVAQLTRPDATSSVHYVGLELTDVQVERFADSGATLFVDHLAYRAEAALTAGTRAALLSDLRQ